VITYKGAMIRIPALPSLPAGVQGPLPAEIEKNPLLIDVVGELKKQDFDSKDIANILRELHRTKAILARLME
jgi:hypothetical protein